ncbi:MAG: ABC transporter permease [Methylacidiphilales bacterium]|nr:ABC transporter permease [Candidatus Methylacidiphilales bacterium]
MKHTAIHADESNSQYWQDLWQYRELFYFFSWRDLLVRYRHALLGITWALLTPILSTLIFTFVFHKVGKFPSYGVPYPMLVLAGLLPWQFFSNALENSSGSMLASANLISKIYFPRLIIPLSCLITSLVEFCIGAVLFVVLMAWYGIAPTWRLLALPFFFGLALVSSAGFGVWLSALTVKYRDFRYVVPFVLRLAMFASPIGYCSDVIPDKWRLVYSLNPLVQVIDGFRWSILQGRTEVYLPGLLLSSVLMLAILLGGLWFFRHFEKNLADII